jgi:hypothetical protein
VSSELSILSYLVEQVLTKVFIMPHIENFYCRVKSNKLLADIQVNLQSVRKNIEIQDFAGFAILHGLVIYIVRVSNNAKL